MSNLFQCHIVQSCLESCSSRDDERICTECIDIATTCYGGIPTPKLCFSNRLEHIHTFHTSGPVTQKLFFRFFILYNRCPLLLPKHIESRFFRSKLEYIGIHYSESWWCSWVGVCISTNRKSSHVSQKCELFLVFF